MTVMLPAGLSCAQRPCPRARQRVQVQSSKDPEGLRVFYYLVQASVTLLLLLFCLSVSFDWPGVVLQGGR